MKKGKKLYEGKAKIIFATSDKNVVIQHFKDDATAFNNQKKASIEGKGILNNRISEHILSSLSEIGIKNHLIKRLNMREQLVEMVNIIPIEFQPSRQVTKINVETRRQAVQMLKSEGIVANPAGAFCSSQQRSAPGEDNAWKPLVGRLMKASSCDILPIRFDGSNSKLFQQA